MQPNPPSHFITVPRIEIGGLFWPRTRVCFIEKLKDLCEIESTRKDKDNETIRDLLHPFV